MAFFSSTPDTLRQVPLYDEATNSALNQARQMGLQGLQQNPLNFAPIEQRELSRFQQEVVPGLAERFTSLGSGAQGSSAFRGALSQGASDLGERLAGLRSQFALQSQAPLQNLLNLGTQQRFQQQFIPGSPSGLSSLLSSILPALGLTAGSYFGGLGGFAGQQLGSKLTHQLGGGPQEPAPLTGGLPAEAPSFMERLQNLLPLYTSGLASQLGTGQLGSGRPTASPQMIGQVNRAVPLLSTPATGGLAPALTAALSQLPQGPQRTEQEIRREKEEDLRKLFPALGHVLGGAAGTGPFGSTAGAAIAGGLPRLLGRK